MKMQPTQIIGREEEEDRMQHAVSTFSVPYTWVTGQKKHHLLYLHHYDYSLIFIQDTELLNFNANKSQCALLRKDLEGISLF